jgi:hypothetical protein
MAIVWDPCQIVDACAELEEFGYTIVAPELNQIKRGIILIAYNGELDDCLFIESDDIYHIVRGGVEAFRANQPGRTADTSPSAYAYRNPHQAELSVGYSWPTHIRSRHAPGTRRERW